MDTVKQFFTTHRKFIVYATIGGCTFVLDYSCFFVSFTYLHAPIFIANAIGLIVGFVVSFIGNRTLVFKTSKENTHHSTLKQVLLYSVLLTFNTILSYGVIRVCQNSGIAPIVGKVVAMFAIAAWNYVIYQKVIFKKKPDLIGVA